MPFKIEILTYKQNNKVKVETTSVLAGWSSSDAILNKDCYFSYTQVITGAAQSSTKKPHAVLVRPNIKYTLYIKRFGSLIEKIYSFPATPTRTVFLTLYVMKNQFFSLSPQSIRERFLLNTIKMSQLPWPFLNAYSPFLYLSSTDHTFWIVPQ